MRTLPAGWPSQTAANQPAPKVYLHVLDGSFPPATVQDGESLPAGWTLVTDWSVECDLDAPLMPGQVNAGSNFTVATATCNIPNPRGGMLAPWRIKTERTPEYGKAELVASYDGYAGATKFVLGQFILDPIKGSASSPFVSVSLVQDLVRLRKPHDLPAQYPNANEQVSFSDPESPTRYLELAAANNGYTLSVTADFPARVTSSYFPMNTDELTAMQTIVGANLGALFLTMDGTTIRVLDAEYLLGTGTLAGTLDVLTNFEDLVWSQDPNAAVDRIEVSYVKPIYNSPIVLGRIPDGKTYSTNPSDDIPGSAWFDPKSAILYPTSPFGTVSLQPVPSGSPVTGQFFVFQRSSGAAVVAMSVPAPGTYTVIGNTTVSAFGNVASQDDAVILAWGKSAANATNTLTFDLGTQIQRRADATAILNRIITRVSSPTFTIDDVRVVPDVRRELGDIFRISFPEAGLNTRAMVTGIKLSGDAGGIVQTLTIAALGLTLTDFDAAWDAVNPSRTLANFDSTWDAISPTLTIADFDAAPLTAS